MKVQCVALKKAKIVCGPGNGNRANVEEGDLVDIEQSYVDRLDGYVKLYDGEVEKSEEDAGKPKRRRRAKSAPEPEPAPVDEPDEAA